MWAQEEVARGGQSGDRPSAAGWATRGGKKAPGHELCLPSPVLTAEFSQDPHWLLLFCSSWVLLQRGVERGSGAPGGSPVGGFVLPCLCLCLWGHVCGVWFAASACRTSINGDGRWVQLLWEAQTGLCGLLEGAKQHLEGWQSSDSRHTFLRPELKSPARSESMQ